MSTRIIEVARDAGDRVVLDLEIASPARGGRGWFVYRSERIASL